MGWELTEFIRQFPAHHCSVIYFNRMDRDFAIFRSIGVPEFRAEFHAGLVELTVQIAHQHIGQGSARKVAHFGSWPSMER